ncbi:MAG: hypothetical protein JO257_09405 [Deltaproteobacteria bacterium]|nr:hypothetical protein [Deltaproteobacteria bacterium]
MEDMKESGVVAAELAHEVRNVITIVSTLAALLGERYGDDPEVEETLTDLRGACDRGIHLARKLTAAARRVVEAAGPTDLSRVLARQVDQLGRIAPAGVRVTGEIDPNMRTPMAKRDVELIVGNLAINAFEAMTAGGTLTIRATRVPLVGAPDFVALVVVDTGPGMDEATLAQCFDIFFTTKPTGTGIGLYSVREAVERAGGRIAIDSAPSRGTTVSMYLPLA